HLRHPFADSVDDRTVEHRLLRTAGVVHARDDPADGHLPAQRRGLGGWPRRIRRSDGRRRVQSGGRPHARRGKRVRARVCRRQHLPRTRFHPHSGHHPNGASDRDRNPFGCASRSQIVKITDIRARVVEWRGETTPLPAHFCTNPMDILGAPEATMSTFTFHDWLIVEVFTDSGLVGIGNAALAPRVTKQVIDLYRKPILIGQDPWDTEYLWQHMYCRTMAFGRKGIGMVTISAVDIALWDLLGKSANQPVFRLLGGRTKARIPVYASRLYSTPLDELAAEARGYRDQGYSAMKLRFGWGP